MKENTEGFMPTENQQKFDRVAVTIACALASMVTSGLVEKGYHSAVTKYRLNKTAA